MTQLYLWTLAGLVFASELLMLGALGYGVWLATGGGVGGVAAAGAAVLAACVLWALFASPKPVFDVEPVKYAVKVGLYLLAALLLARGGVRAEWVWAFAGFSLVTNIAAVLPPYRDFGG